MGYHILSWLIIKKGGGGTFDVLFTKNTHREFSASEAKERADITRRANDIGRRFVITQLLATHPCGQLSAQSHPELQQFIDDMCKNPGNPSYSLMDAMTELDKLITDWHLKRVPVVINKKPASHVSSQTVSEGQIRTIFEPMDLFTHKFMYVWQKFKYVYEVATVTIAWRMSPTTGSDCLLQVAFNGISVSGDFQDAIMLNALRRLVTAFLSILKSKRVLLSADSPLSAHAIDTEMNPKRILPLSNLNRDEAEAMKHFKRPTAQERGAANETGNWNLMNLFNNSKSQQHMASPTVAAGSGLWSLKNLPNTKANKPLWSTSKAYVIKADVDSPHNNTPPTQANVNNDVFYDANGNINSILGTVVDSVNVGSCPSSPHQSPPNAPTSVPSHTVPRPIRTTAKAPPLPFSTAPRLQNSAMISTSDLNSFITFGDKRKSSQRGKTKKKSKRKRPQL
jgi:hypothetical protein